MDDRGRLAQPLKRIARLHLHLTGRGGGRGAADARATRPRSRLAGIMDRWSSFLDSKWPRGLGVAASGLVILASLGYGAIKGNHIPQIVAGLKEARDGIANAAGLRLVSIALAGNHHVSREEVLASAGITGITSLLFLDVEQVGERRWNLRLKNGIDVRLPESDVAPALERLVALDREKNLITRDIVAIDLRLADRVTVRLTDAAAQARMDASKDKPKKRDGNA